MAPVRGMMIPAATAARRTIGRRRSEPRPREVTAATVQGMRPTMHQMRRTRMMKPIRASRIML